MLGKSAFEGQYSSLHGYYFQESYILVFVDEIAIVLAAERCMPNTLAARFERAWEALLEQTCSGALLQSKVCC